MTLKQASLKYCEAGWYIFPITTNEKMPPLVPWREESSNDPEQIKKWWGEVPNANIGLDCGKSGIIVIDVDIKQGGMANWNILCEENNIDPADTMRIITPSQGRHIFYLAPDIEIGNSRNLEGHGIDVRGVGGYVVLPPSVTKKGRYKVDREV